MGSPDEQKSEDNKTLDEHSKGEKWSESSESADLRDDSHVRISRNKLCKKEDSNKKIKENFRWRKREPPVVDSTFHVKDVFGPLFTEISPYMYFKLFFDDEYCRSNLIYIQYNVQVNQ